MIHFVHYLNFPSIPTSIIDALPKNYDEYDQEKFAPSGNRFCYSRSFTADLDKWCKQNICPSSYFGFQLIHEDLHVHKDEIALIKLIYLIDPGGEKITTTWYDDDFNKVTAYEIEPFRWCLMKIDWWHDVVGIEPGRSRVAVASKMFEK